MKRATHSMKVDKIVVFLANYTYNLSSVMVILNKTRHVRWFARSGFFTQLLAQLNNCSRYLGTYLGINSYSLWPILFLSKFQLTGFARQNQIFSIESSFKSCSKFSIFVIYQKLHKILKINLRVIIISQGTDFF